jgi:hypothetical protein
MRLALGQLYSFSKERSAFMVPDIVPLSNPFDKIRYQDDTGEWWWARELMPLLGYEQWKNFAEAIERARIAARNSGYEPDLHFCRSRQKGTGGRPRDDFRLTRFACYMIAINGDPNKAEIADAQSYFVIKAREAEVALPERNLLEPKLDPDLARIYELTVGMQQTRNEVKAIEAAQQQMASELHEVSQDVADLKAISPISSRNMLSLRDAARAVTGNEMGQVRFKRWLLDKGIMFTDHQGHDRLYQTWVSGGLGIERWEEWSNGRGWSWVPYFTALGVARLRQTYMAEEDGAVAA